MTDAHPNLAPRPWVPEEVVARVRAIAQATRADGPEGVAPRIETLAAESRAIHDVDGINLNPATNTMNPRAEALLAAGIGTRPSLGYPGAKYEMGLEAIEQIEVVAAELAAQVFDAAYAEVRVGSGAMANLYTFMAAAEPGDAIIVPPATIAGHVTHHRAGAAGLYGLRIHEAPIDADNYTLDVAGLAALAAEVRPKLISVGGSLNLTHHDVAGVRAVADDLGAIVLFDAAHLSGPIAGGAWPNPLAEGAHVMTMSTYKSLAGPPSGLLVTTDSSLAERVDAIAYPGLTANFDVGATAALAVTLADWLLHGEAHAAAMIDAADGLAAALDETGVAVHHAAGRATRSHAFALDARETGGGHALAVHLRRANLLASAIGLPSGLDDGLRLGTNELVRWGARRADMAELAALISQAIDSDRPEALIPEVRSFRARFDRIGFVA